jgi:hypothetical protein
MGQPKSAAKKKFTERQYHKETQAAITSPQNETEAGIGRLIQKRIRTLRETLA